MDSTGRLPRVSTVSAMAGESSPGVPLPPQLVEADARLARLLERHRFVDHLNPRNAREARAAWRADGGAPPFEYLPVPWADEVLFELDTIEVPDHPLGRPLAEAIRETGLFVEALSRRTAEAFDTLARAAGWYAGPVEVPRVTPGSRHDDPPIPAAEMAAALRTALAERGFHTWVVRADPTLASRVLVDAPRREVRVNPAAPFRESDRRLLVAHEIDVHVARSANGERQPLSLFRTGLPRAIATEEGLAVVAEEELGAPPGPFHARRALLASAVEVARTAGFRAVHDHVEAQTNREAAWTIALRVKRGLADPEAPGTYAKDSVYWLGHRLVRAWRDAGRPLDPLYVGKVGVDDPVEEWIAAGWVTPGPVPRLWFNRPGSGSA